MSIYPALKLLYKSPLLKSTARVCVYLVRPGKVGPHQQQHQANVEQRNRLEYVYCTRNEYIPVTVMSRFV